MGVGEEADPQTVNDVAAEVVQRLQACSSNRRAEHATAEEVSPRRDDLAAAQAARRERPRDHTTETEVSAATTMLKTAEERAVAARSRYQTSRSRLEEILKRMVTSIARSEIVTILSNRITNETRLARRNLVATAFAVAAFDLADKLPDQLPIFAGSLTDTNALINVAALVIFYQLAHFIASAWPDAHVFWEARLDFRESVAKAEASLQATEAAMGKLDTSDVELVLIKDQVGSWRSKCKRRLEKDQRKLLSAYPKVAFEFLLPLAFGLWALGRLPYLP